MAYVALLIQINNFEFQKFGYFLGSTNTQKTENITYYFD